MTTAHRGLVLVAVLMPAFLTIGCSDDDKPNPTDPDPIEVADSPDRLVELFREAYAARDLEQFTALLHDDYLWVGQGEDALWPRDLELLVTERMFTGQEGPGFVISTITVAQFTSPGAWQQTPEDDPNFGDVPESSYRSFVVDIDFYVAGQNMRLRVQGPAFFYVAPVGDEYHLLGIVDATFGNLASGKATENHSWTGVKSLFL